MGWMVVRLTQICQATRIIFDENSKHNGKRLQTNFTEKQIGQSDLLFWWVIIDRCLAHPAHGERGERSLLQILVIQSSKGGGGERHVHCVVHGVVVASPVQRARD